LKITVVPCPLRYALTLAALLACSSASASIYRVGSGAGCTHSNVQAAVTAAESNPGADKIQVA